MHEQKIEQLLRELQKEIAQNEGLDKDLVSSVQQLEADIEALLNPKVDSSDNTVLDDVIALEASFAANYPVAEKIIRELVNNLSRIGI